MPSRGPFFATLRSLDGPTTSIIPFFHKRIIDFKSRNLIPAVGTLKIIFTLLATIFNQIDLDCGLVLLLINWIINDHATSNVSADQRQTIFQALIIRVTCRSDQKTLQNMFMY